MILCQVSIGGPIVILRPGGWSGCIGAVPQLRSPPAVYPLVIEQERILITPVQAVKLPIKHIIISDPLALDVPGAGIHTRSVAIVVAQAPPQVALVRAHRLAMAEVSPVHTGRADVGRARPLVSRIQPHIKICLTQYDFSWWHALAVACLTI